MIYTLWQFFQSFEIYIIFVFKIHDGSISNSGVHVIRSELHRQATINDGNKDNSNGVINKYNFVQICKQIGR